MSELTSRLSSAREEADKAAKTLRELSEARRQLKAETERANGLRWATQPNSNPNPNPNPNPNGLRSALQPHLSNHGRASPCVTARPHHSAHRRCHARPQRVRRAKLLNAQEALNAAEAAAAAEMERRRETGSGGASASLLEKANAELEGLLRAARAECRDLRQELVAKGNTLVDVGSQLSVALDAASTAEQKASALDARLGQAREVRRTGGGSPVPVPVPVPMCARVQVCTPHARIPSRVGARRVCIGHAQVEDLLLGTQRERDELQAALEDRQIELASAQARHAEALEQAVASAAAGGGGGGAAAASYGAAGGGGEGVAEALAAENATLRAEKAAMETELSALSPAFFEEIEDLKYAHYVAREQLQRYEQAFGPLPE